MADRSTGPLVANGYADSKSSSNPQDAQCVLAGKANYDDLGEQNQAAVRINWDQQIAAPLTQQDLAAEFSQTQRS